MGGVLATASIPAGTYSQLRIVIIGGCVETSEGSVFATADYGGCGEADGELRMPSFDASGLKVMFDEVEVTESGQLTGLSFDIAEAFGHGTGRSGWNMEPEIAASGFVLTAGIDVTLSEGSVTMPSGVELGQFSATLVPAVGESSEVSFVDANSNGVFEVTFQSLLPENGPFSVQLNPPSDVTADVTPSSPTMVNPAAGQVANVDWVLTNVTKTDDGVICGWWVCN